MADHRSDTEPSPFNFNNVVFILFKWKKTILLLTLIGLAIAAAIYFLYPASYESDATLLVRYVV
ncbi:MAG: hypothetical protein JO354_05485, partial [Verrucomicrobia bacterium]|nr:hypothetical protein [Verrucomicrobiota bacterium]